MSTDEVTRPLGHDGGPGPHSGPLRPSGRADLFLLLAEVERLARAAEAALSGYLEVVRVEHAKVAAAEMDLAAAVADGARRVSEVERDLYHRLVERIPGATSAVCPDLEPF